ncbi:MAG TPA: ankyrin repeat domain-containing protein, partial [Desulfomonilaceae bacterium]|nr:ankyrin repeat domain-containing protein [Desulfomonilaceae bacterium]
TWACSEGRPGMVRLLLEKGADVNCGGQGHENSPLSVASQKRYKDIMDLLLKYGAESTDSPQDES